MEFVTFLYLAFMFIALYFFSFFVILIFRNKTRLFEYPKPDYSNFVSVIIPVFNEEESIEDTIKHVCSSEYPANKLEVIVVSDGSTDNTNKIVKDLMKKYKILKLLTKNNSGKADSINCAIKISKGNLIAVVDADSFPDKESLAKLTGYFRDPKMAAVTSFVSVRNKSVNLLTRIQSLEYLIMGWSRKLLDFIDSVYVTNGPLSVYRKKYIVEVGGFDKKSITEDIDITWNCLNHGYKTAMCLDARVSTVTPSVFKKWFRQRERWGLGGLQALVKYKEMFFKRGMFGIFVMPYVTFSIFLSLATFIFSVYLLTKTLIVNILSDVYSIYGGVPIMVFDDFSFAPSAIFIYFVILFIISISYTYYSLKQTDPYRTLSNVTWKEFLFYILVYATLYPIVWFSAIYRFIIKDYKW